MPLMKYQFDGLWIVELDGNRKLCGKVTSAQMAGKLWMVIFNAMRPTTAVNDSGDKWEPIGQKMVFINPDRVVSAHEVDEASVRVLPDAA
jgi:hypothetical protein